MSDTRVHCTYCHRRSIGVDKTGRLVPHHTKPRQGLYCQGSEQAPVARPERRAA